MAITVDDIVVSESATFARFFVRLTAPSAQTVTVSYSTFNQTAVNGSDYTTQAGTLTFLPGQTALTVDIPIVNGNVLEFTESFAFVLSSAVNAAISKDVAIATIVDNDATAGTPTLKLADKVVDEAAGTVTFVVTLDKPSTGVVTVNYATASGTATSGSDFVGVALQTLTFAAGEVSKSVTVNLVNDAATEGGEYFDLLLSGAVGATLTDTTARAFIGKSEQPLQTTPVISVANAQAGEGQGTMDFVVSLSGPSSQAVSVNYGMLNGTAVNGADHSAYSGTLLFEAGETVKTVRVGLVENTSLESPENFFLTLSGATGATLGNNVAIGTIVDNDAVAGTPLIELGDVVVDEKAGRAYVTVTLDRPSTSAVSVNYATAAGSAAASADFQAQAAQTLTFAAGEMSKTLVIDLVDDAGVEGGEFFDVVFSAAVGATLTDTTARVFIGESDQPLQTTPVVSIANAQAGESQDSMDFVVSLSGPSSQAVSVNYGMLNGTAVNGADFGAYSGTLVFEAGETVKTIRVALIENTLLEASESFFLTLSGASGATLGNNVALGTIVDNDAAAGTPLIELSDVIVDEKAGRAYLTVTLDRPSTGTVSVNYATTGGSATAGSDYQTQLAQTLTFSAGETTKTIAINIVDDAVAEAGEFFDVVFSAPVGATLPDTRARVFIGASDQAEQTLPKLSVADAQAGEGQGTMDFVISLSAPSRQAVSVNYGMLNGTATNGADFGAYSGTLVFEAGETVKTVRVGLIENTTLEASQSFFLTLSGVSGATLGNNVAIGTIVDNDTAAGTPLIELGDVVVDERIGRAYLTVTLDRPSTGAVSVSYATAAGSAAASADFQAQAAQTLTFAAGEMSKTLVIDLVDDATVEGGEFFDVVFSAAVGATLTDKTARVFIGESDQPLQTTPVISVADAQAGEGQGHLEFVVSLSGPSSQAVSVNYGMLNGTATNGADYGAYSGTLVFEAGETVKTVRVSLIENATLESPEAFYLTLSGASGATLGHNVAIGTIVDNDAAAGTPLIELGDVIVDEKAGRAYVTVTLDRPSTGTVSVSYATTNGSAAAGSDYEAQAAQTLTFSAGETSKTITVNLVDDVAVERGEFFDVVLSAAVGATLPDTNARVFIGASDQPVQALPVVSVANAQGGEGQGTMDFVVSLSGPSSQAISVNYGMLNGTATTGADYGAASGTLVFEAGETVKTVRVGVIENASLESLESFFLTLSGASGATVGNNVAIGTIVDNDAVAGAPVIQVADAIVDEKDGRAYITVSLDRPSAGTVTVRYVTSSGTAQAGSDFEAQAIQTLSFAAGETSKTIAVNLIDDTTAEATGEIFDVVFSSPTGATLADTRAHVVIARNDTLAANPPTLTVSAPVIAEGGGYVDFVVALSSQSTQTASVNYSTFNGTAVNGSDFTAQSGTLVFEPGETVKVVRVGIENNALAEAAEAFSLTLSGAVGVTLGTASAVGNIIDDDPAPAAGVTVTGTTGPDILRGLATADTLNGGAGNDVLDGGAGNDTLAGGTADDVYIVEVAGDTVTEAAGAGNDTVLSYLSSYTLGANVENLVLGSGAGSAIGNALNNRIVGNAANNTLDGGDGADTIDGAGGIDTVTYALSSAGVSVDLTANTALGGSAQGDTFANVENLRGSALDDSLTGNSGANTLQGGVGNDLLRGLDGIDTLLGEDGNDTLVGGNGADTATGGAGLDTFVFGDLSGLDTVTDFSAVNDTFRFDMVGILIGNGNTTVDGGVLRAAPGGFAATAELVVFTTDIAGAITAASAAAQIGSATSAYAVGADVLFAVDNGTQTGIFAFQSADGDALVSANEVTQIALVNGDATSLADYTFGP